MAHSSTHVLHGQWDAPVSGALGGVSLSWHAHTLELRRGARVEHVYSFKEHVRDACTTFMNDQPALCIVLDRMLYVHMPHVGEAFTVPLTFCTARVFPLQKGILLVRDQRAHDGASAGPQAYFLQGVFDHLSSWALVESIQTDAVHGTLQSFPELGEHIVHVDPLMSLIVTARADALRLYTYRTSSDPLRHTSPPATQDPELLRPRKVARRSSARRSRRSSRHVSEPMLSRRVSDLGTSFSMLPVPEPRPPPPTNPAATATAKTAASAPSLAAPAAAASTTSAAATMARRATGPPASSMFLDGADASLASVGDVNPLFSDFARGHAYVALLDDISVPHLPHADASVMDVHAFSMDSLLYMVIPSCSRIFCRHIIAGPRIAPPVHTRADAVLAARDACLVSIVRRHDAMALLHEDGRLVIACGPPGTAACVEWGRGIDAVRCRGDLEVCVQGQWTPRPVFMRPACELTAHILESLCLSLPTRASSEILARFLERRLPTWQGLEHALCMEPNDRVHEADEILACLGLSPAVQEGSSKARSSAAAAAGVGAGVGVGVGTDVTAGCGHPGSTTTSVCAFDAYVAMALHMLAQDSFLDVHRRRTHTPILVQLLLRIVERLGWTRWSDAWTRLVPVASQTIRPPAGPAPPEHLYVLLERATRGHPPSLTAYADDLASSLHLEPLSNIRTCCTMAAAVLDVYAVLAEATSAQPVADAILQHRLRTSRLPPGIALPLEEVLRTCQLDPPHDASADMYTLLRRADAKAAAFGAPPATVPASMLTTLAPGLDPLSAQIFHADFRLLDVARMLMTTHPHTARMPVDVDDAAAAASSLPTSAMATAMAKALAERTMAQCVGRGLFRYASRPLRTTGTWRTPRLCLTLRTLPDGNLISDTHAASELDWPEFHNGVASALEIGTAHVDSSWIFAHASSSRGGRARHAGFLLGLGLHGHLRRLGRVHAYRYLAPRHTLTTIGLVLGLAASFLGSGDTAARQVMAVQVAAFLPPGSVPLHMSTITQATGLLGMGLVFCETDHRWTAARLATQLDAQVDTADANEAHLDLYAQCAGLGLGLVYLGRARRSGGMTSASDHALVLRLCRSVAACDDVPPLAAARTAAASCLALALMFLRSGRVDIADALAPPTAATLAHIRPDLLLLRALARSLILGDAVPDDAWLRQTCVWQDPAGLDTPSTLAFFQIRAGACLALGLQYAGTADERARVLLLRQLMFEAPTDASFEARVVQAAWSTLQNVVHISLACVMAGTGDVHVLRVLRAAHGCLDVSYGTHLATHMALGLLFLGGGRFSVSQSDKALAMMLIAFLPSFPAAPDDSRAHLQAARHLSILALAPRLVAARDVSSNEVCFLPMSSDHVRLEAPTLVPAGTLSVSTRSRRYWPASCILDHVQRRAPIAASASSSSSSSSPSPMHQAALVHWLHVQRRTGFLSYADDPHGHRSIFARTARSAVPQLGGDINGTCMMRDLAALIHGFKTAPEAQLLVHYVCSANAGLGAFCASILLDGLLRDAPMLMRVYLALWTGTYEQDASDRVLFVHDTQLLHAWYASPADAVVRGSRERLLPRDMLDSVLWQLMCQLAPALSEVAAYVRGTRAPLTRSGASALATLRAPLLSDLEILRTCFASTPRPLAVHALRHVLDHDRLVQMCVDAW